MPVFWKAGIQLVVQILDDLLQFLDLVLQDLNLLLRYPKPLLPSGCI
jgi:hypothetical protein